MYNAMSSPISSRPQAATRHLPVAHGRDRSDGKERTSIAPRLQSETRLQSAKVSDAGSDPYGNVACTD